MGRAVLSAVLGLAGAAAGCFGLFVLANSEDYQFYTVRSWATGRTALSEIINHPADRWAVHGLQLMFIGGGAMVGVLLARLLCRARPTGSSAAATSNDK